MTKQQQIIIAVLALAVVCVFSVLCLTIAGLSSTRQPTSQLANFAPVPSVTSTPRPSSTPTPIPIAFEEIVATYNRMTEIQRKEYLPTLVGQRVQWSAKVSEVKSDGSVDINMEKGFLTSLSYRVYLQRVPKEIAVTLQKGQNIEFQGTIAKAYDSLGVRIDVDYISLRLVTPTPVPSSTPRPTSTRAVVTATPTGLNYRQIWEMFQKYDKSEISSLQFNRYLQGLKGQKVMWTSPIRNVYAGRLVTEAEITIDVGECIACYVAIIVPASRAKDIKPGQTIEFDGRIEEAEYVVGLVGLSRGVSLRIRPISYKVY